jgi:hypothetical protein
MIFDKIKFYLSIAIFLIPISAESQQLRLLGSLDLPQSPGHCIAYSHKLVFIGTYTQHRALAIVDVSNPYQPSLLSITDSVSYSFNTQDIELSKGYAYLTDRDASFIHVYNTENPLSPILASSFRTHSFPHTIDIYGNFLYLSNCSAGLKIIDITNPYAMTLFGVYEPDNIMQFECQYLRFPYIFITGNYFGLAVLNVIDPTNPVLEACDSTYEFSTYNIAAYQNMLYLSNFGRNLKLCDISNPNTPVFLGNFYLDFNYEVKSLVTYLNYLFVGTDSCLFVYDISIPANPILVAQNQEGDYKYIIIDNGLVYSAGRNSMSIFSFSPSDINNPSPDLSQSSRLIQAYPNPFNSSTTITFSIPDIQSASISIYDFLGRKVIGFNQAELHKGNNRIQWYGQDENGRPLPSGIYFCRLDSPKSNLIRKIILLK